MEKITKKFNFIPNVNKTSSIFWLIIISLSIFIISTILLLQNIGRANAQVATFYSTTCLGGWKNTEKAIGAPDVEKGSVGEYNNDNSASISNTVAQIFCGGFKGEIPTDTFQKRIILRFSWSMDGALEINEVISLPSENENIFEFTNAASVILGEEEIGGEITEDQIILPIERPAEIISTEEVSAEEELPRESGSVPETSPDLPGVLEEEIETKQEAPPVEESSIRNMFFSTAHAQETEEIKIKEEASALLEILYTLDGNNWETLGYVSSITNNVNFEMPMDIFTTIADLERVQIAIRTVPTYDNVPTIYLDSVWLDVEYQKIPVTKGISGFKVFVLTQEKLESNVNEWLANQQNIIVDDLKVEDYGGGGYLVVISYHTGEILGNSTARLKLIIGENPEKDAQTFLASLDSSNTVRSISAVAGSYSSKEATITVPIIFIVYE